MTSLFYPPIFICDYNIIEKVNFADFFLQHKISFFTGLSKGLAWLGTNRHPSKFLILAVKIILAKGGHIQPPPHQN